MKNKKVLTAAAAILGLACALIGLFVITDPVQKGLSGLCAGIGSAAFALGLGSLLRLIMVPTERQKQAQQKEIEVHDERNMRIREKAGAMANRIVFYVLCAALLALGLLGDLLAVLVLTGILVLEFVLIVILTGRYSKQM